MPLFYTFSKETIFSHIMLDAKPIFAAFDHPRIFLTVEQFHWKKSHRQNNQTSFPIQPAVLGSSDPVLHWEQKWCSMMFYDVLWYSMMFLHVLWCSLVFYDVLWVNSFLGFFFLEQTSEVPPVFFLNLALHVCFSFAPNTFGTPRMWEVYPRKPYPSGKIIKKDSHTDIFNGQCFDITTS